MSSTAALELEQLSVRYGAKLALDRVDLRLEPGELVALVGPSGCGKSSLLRAVAGLVPSSGGVRAAGLTFNGLAAHRRRVGVVFQDHALFPHLSVFDNVAFGLVEARLPGKEQRRAVDTWLQQVGLEGRAREGVDTLSGGERQRVALARALAPEPPLMLLDEPFASLDAPLRRELSELVSGWLRKLGIASLFVTHDLNEALAIADRVALLREGRLVQCSTPQGLMNHPVDAWTATFSGHPNVYRGSMASRLPGAGSTRASGGDALLLAEACDWQPGGESSTGVRAICRRAELLRDGWRLTLEVPSWGVEVIWSARSRELPSEHQPPARDTEGVLIAPPHAWRSWPEVTQ